MIWLIGSWIAVIFGITGAIANIYKKWWCFVLWNIANIYLIVYNVYLRDYSQASLFFVYFILSTCGLISWFLKEKEHND